MRPAYTIQATAKLHSDDHAEGTTDRDVVYVDEDFSLIVEPGRHLPELGQKRIFAVYGKELVLPIGDRRFKVTFESDYDEGTPQPGIVTFEETEEPETPYILWDAEEVARKRLAKLKSLPASYNIDRDIYEVEQELASGYLDYYTPKDYTSAFGQPIWKQSPCFPSHNGKAAFHLVTFDSEWGDCGNENYMVTLDAEGYPEVVFYEASCC